MRIKIKNKKSYDNVLQDDDNYYKWADAKVDPSKTTNIENKQKHRGEEYLRNNTRTISFSE